MNLSTATVSLLGALTEASSLFVAAAGLTLVFGALRIINIAHGSFYMYGAYIVAMIVGASTGGSFWLALVVAPLTVAAGAMVVEVLVMRRIYRRDPLVQVIVTYSLFLIFAGLAVRAWGATPLSVAAPNVLSGSLAMGSRTFPAYYLFAIGAAGAVGVAMWALLQRTSLGWRIRAAVEDPELLASSGTNVPLLITAVFAMGGALAGLGAAIATPMGTIQPGLDSTIIIQAFIVAVIGGLGSVSGAAIGAIVISLFNTAGAIWAPTWEPEFIYLAMIVVLAVRPWGLLGAPER